MVSLGSLSGLELSDTQAAAMLLGQTASSTSEKFVWVNPWAVTKARLLGATEMAKFLKDRADFGPAGIFCSVAPDDLPTRNLHPRTDEGEAA